MGSKIVQLGRHEKLDPLTMVIDAMEDNEGNIDNIVLTIKNKDGEYITYISEAQSYLLAEIGLVYQDLALQVMRGEI